MPAPVSAEGSAPANDEAQSNCGCKENEESSHVATVQAKEKTLEGANHQTIKQSVDALHEVIEIHGAASVVACEICARGSRQLAPRDELANQLEIELRKIVTTPGPPSARDVPRPAVGSLER